MAADVRQEMQIMYHLSGHPGVVQLLEAFEDQQHVHLVMELCSGGELVDRIEKRKKYTERDAATAIRGLLEVVAYAHDLGVVHRDIKPDNLLIAGDDEDSPIKLADYGYSTFVKPGEKIRGVVGTSFYVAPEVLLGEYDEKADVWSVGVVLYVLLCGRPPFYAIRDEDVFKKIVEDGVPNMCKDPWPSISEEAKDAVRQMMTWQPEIRPSARDMLKHEWIREGGTAGDNLIQPEVVHRLKSFGAMNKFKKHAAIVIATHLPSDQIRGLRELFDSMDQDHSGTITAEELALALERRGSHIPEDELKKLMAVADVNGDGQLAYDEFLASTLHQSRLTEAANLQYAFQFFDTNGDGTITEEELAGALAATGKHSVTTAAAAAHEMIEAADADGDGRVDFGEFVDMMMTQGSGCAGGSPQASGSSRSGRTRMGAALGMTRSGRVPSGDVAALTAGGRTAAAVEADVPSSDRRGGRDQLP